MYSITKESLQNYFDLPLWPGHQKTFVTPGYSYASAHVTVCFKGLMALKSTNVLKIWQIWSIYSVFLVNPFSWVDYFKL